MNIEAINLQCVRDDRVLFSQLNFNVNSGEILFIRGPNGSGKTSLLRILAGLFIPTTGNVHWCGQPIVELADEYRANIAYLGHKVGIKIGLTVLENLRLTHFLSNVQTNYNFAELLLQFDLHDYKNTLAQKLSAGQRQRIALIRLLASAAKVWILDEPLTSLDTVAIIELQKYLKLHVENGGMAILTSHQQLNFDTAKIIELHS